MIKFWSCVFCLSNNNTCFEQLFYICFECNSFRSFEHKLGVLNILIMQVNI
ncbi:hypothetical protein ACJIZ3_006266 [Penstemon smallii]|uniref:Uncharacterized protein n=1 Tax=Penstemon smallii TaxID=265156 RepID=A0ABD3S7E2_9LAMI